MGACRRTIAARSKRESQTSTFHINDAFPWSLPLQMISPRPSTAPLRRSTSTVPAAGIAECCRSCREWEGTAKEAHSVTASKYNGSGISLRPIVDCVCIYHDSRVVSSVQQKGKQVANRRKERHGYTVIRSTAHQRRSSCRDPVSGARGQSSERGLLVHLV